MRGAVHARNRATFRIAIAAAMGTAALWPVGASADPTETGALDDRPAQSAALEPDRPPSIQSSLGIWGDPGGIRATLGGRGLTYNLLSTNEVLGNVSGGIRRGPIHAGKLEAAFTADLDRLAGWTGWSAFANVFQIHDTGGLRDRSFQRLITVSNIEAYPSTRLSELWVERRWEDDHLGLRVGQLVADGEFFSADTGKVFLSNDWPTITGANLPSGGPAYPLATPGLRLRWDPAPSATALLAVFNGDPGNQATVNRTGTNFRLNDAPLVMGEVQIRTHLDPRDGGLSGSVKLGGYRHFGRFDDLRYDRAGLPLASPASSGHARRMRGTSGLYAVVDQHVYRWETGSGPRGMSVYARVSTSPSDRNLIDLWADGGVVVLGMIPQRPDDSFGASVIYARIGEAARGYDRDASQYLGGFNSRRSYEATVELTYQATIRPGWTVQPDIQYVFRPGGGIADQTAPGRTIKGGAVFGLRSTLTY